MRTLLKIFICTVLAAPITSSQGQTAFGLEAWLKQDRGFKLALVKGFIDVAKEDKVTLRLPTEYYVKELDNLVENSIKNRDEARLKTSVGIALKTIAVMDCDWDNGKDRFEEARAFLGEATFDFYKKNYPAKYQKLINGCR